MANYAIIPIGDAASAAYLHHGIARTRAGRVYCSAAYWDGALWKNCQCWSNNNGVAWNYGTVPWYGKASETGGQVVVDGGNNLHMFFRTANPYGGYNSACIAYGVMDGACGQWSSRRILIQSAGTAIDVPAAAVGAYNNYLMLVVSDATAANNNQVWYCLSTDNGKTFAPAIDASVWTVSLQAGQGTYGLCSDLSGNFHCVHDWNDPISGFYEICYNKFDSTAKTWGATTYLTTGSSGTQYWPDVACDIYGQVHVAWVGRVAGDGGFTSLRYRRYTGGAWEAIQNLTTEAVANALEASVVLADSSGTASQPTVTVACKAWDAGSGQYEIRMTASNNGGAAGGWSPFVSISDTAVATQKFYLKGAYQVWPNWSRPYSGYAFGYMLGTSTADYATWYVTNGVTWNDVPLTTVTFQ